MPRSEHSARLVIRSVRTMDGDNLRGLYPASDDDVDYLLRLVVGSVGEAGEHVFFVRVVSVAALRLLAESGAFVLASRGALVVNTFDWREVLRHLKGILSRCEKERFQSSVSRLRRYFLEEQAQT